MKTIIAFLLSVGVALAQSTNFDSLRGSSRVVTNEQDLVALAALSGVSNALQSQISAISVAGNGISNVVVNGKYGVYSGSGSNVITTVTLVPSDLGTLTAAEITNVAQSVSSGITAATATNIAGIVAGTTNAAHVAATDPHGDRAYTDGKISPVAAALSAFTNAQASDAIAFSGFTNSQSANAVAFSAITNGFASTSNAISAAASGNSNYTANVSQQTTNALNAATNALDVTTIARDYPRSNPSNWITSATATGIAQTVASAYVSTNDTRYLAALTNTPTFQQIINTGNSSTNLGDISGPGRFAFGSGMSVNNIAANAYGAEQRGWNNGGTMTIGTASIGAAQNGISEGVMTIGISAYGSHQYGVCYNKMEISDSAIGAMQNGKLTYTATATNAGVGAVQIFDLTSGQHATTTSGGAASLLLGAGIASNRNAIVSGDGQVSHGNGSITASGGFFGDGSGLTGVTPAQIGAISNTPAGIAGANIITNNGTVTHLYTSTMSGYRGDEMVSAAFVRSLFSGGTFLYNITNLNTINTNFYTASFASNDTLQVRTYSAITNNQYLSRNGNNTSGGIMSTTQFYTVYSPMSIDAYISWNWSSSRDAYLTAEFYVSEDGTNFTELATSSAQQLPQNTATNKVSFTLSFPTYTSANGVYVVRQFKVSGIVGTVNVSIYGGDSYPSHISFSTPPSTDLGIRGATNIVDSTGANHGAYNTSTRVLTLPTAGQMGALTNNQSGVTLAGTITATGGNAITNGAIPAAGCTDLGSGASGIISGATVSYRYTPTVAWTASVASAASRYCYAMEVQATNAYTLSAGLTLMGTHTITGTNIFTFVPYTGTLWRVYARGL